MKYITASMGAAAVLLAAMCVEAAPPTYSLEELTFNIDGSGAVYDYFNPVGSPSVPGVNLSGFNTATGLGTIQYSVTGAGQHQFISFFDHEIDLLVNGYLNEVGSAHGTPAAGQSWEIDEPGFGNALGYTGDIYNNVVGSAVGNDLLDNSVGTPNPNDVSMAMGFDFSLSAGDQATIDLSLTTTAPTSGFYLQQNDPASQASVFLAGKLVITPTAAGVPDTASTVTAFSLALVALASFGQVSRSRAK